MAYTEEFGLPQAEVILANEVRHAIRNAIRASADPRMRRMSKGWDGMNRFLFPGDLPDAPTWQELFPDVRAASRAIATSAFQSLFGLKDTHVQPKDTPAEHQAP